MKRQTKKRAFTLIELIVVMAVIGILVLLAAPKFLGYTERARHTKLITTSKELERASERYFMDFEDWPRLTDDAYTADEIYTFAEKIYDISGEEVTLDPAGNYYDIDYDKLSSFIKEPDDRKNYVLRNPVGKIYALENINEMGKNRVSYPSNFEAGELDKETEEPEPQNESNVPYAKAKYADMPADKVNNFNITSTMKEYDDGQIVLSGLGAAAFDNNINTYVSKATGPISITWTGDLTHREIEIKAQTLSGEITIYVEFRDINNNPIVPLGESASSVLAANYSGIKTKKLIVPEGATQLVITGGGRIYDINVPQSSERPEISYMNFEPGTSSMKMTWDTVNKVIIYRDGVLRGTYTGQTYTDTTLYSDKEYRYDVVFMDANGNGQKYSYTTKTAFHIAAFRGVGAEAFDNNIATSVSSGSGIITWTGDLTHREIVIKAEVFSNGNSYHIEFMNAENIPLVPVGEVTSKILIASYNNMRTKRLIVPEGAVKIAIYAVGSSKLYDINVPQNSERPEINYMNFEPGTSSMKMTWDTVNKVIIYRDGVLRGTYTGQTYTDTPLYSDKEYRYDVVYMDANGNGQKYSYTTKTAFHIAAFRGVGAEAFDSNISTSVSSGSGIITWTGDLTHREIEVKAEVFSYGNSYHIEFMNAENIPLVPVGEVASKILIASYANMRTKRLIVPEGAVKIAVYAVGSSKLYDINIIK